VEAADNVVYAYDLCLQMPEIPLTPVELDEQALSIPITFPSRTGCDIGSPTNLGRKRTREHDAEPGYYPGPPLKRTSTMETELSRSYFNMDSAGSSAACQSMIMTEQPLKTKVTSDFSLRSETTSSGGYGRPATAPARLSSTRRRIVTRDFIRNLVNEAVRSGHPMSEVHTPTDLGETIEVRSLGSRGQVQEIMIHWKIERDVPGVIITEEQHLQFSLAKVIDNAIKFTDSGSIRIAVQLGKHLQVVEILVADTGCGIAEESKQSLFKPHFQEDASISRSRDGLGLSLFNAKAHVRKNLGGDVTLEHSATGGPSRGSEFLIRLPLSSVEAGPNKAPLVGALTPPAQSRCRLGSWADQGASLNGNASDTASNFSITPTRQSSPTPSPRDRVSFNPKLAMEYPLNILIAEDNAINRGVAMGSLNKLGYSKDHITVAFDGIEAVQHYAASLSKPAGQGFDAILMDIWMPNMDGYEATKKIMDLAKEAGATTKIVAVTADITGDCIKRAKSAGMQGFLAKPYKVLDIEHLIVEHFGKGLDESRDG
jgi:CheY-like chemotaxis protein